MDSKRRSTRLYSQNKKRDRDDFDSSSDLNNDQLLEGLEIDDGYVKIDETLLKRLKRDDIDDEVESINQEQAINRIHELFNDAPEYADLLVNSEPLDKKTLETFSKQLAKNTAHKKTSEMVANIPLEFLALQRADAYAQDYEYRYKPSCQPRVTNQYHSGRCWMFASLNLLRYGLISKLNL
ncbi:unnamed protein product, partial [marine sediment metagenome]